MTAQGREELPPDVELQGVTKRFGDFTAVDDVSLAIRPGEFLSLLGPSGCGKSTTLRLIAGFERPTEGHVLIRGRIVNDVPPYRRETNLVFQQLALFPHLNVYDNIAYGLRIKGVASREIARRVKGVLELVDLPGFERRPIRGLSGGQQQRVAIARALVNEPAVLLLDEPLGSLDLKLRVQMQLELKALQHRVGTTFVYVTHDQGEALAMSDRIAVMNRGRIEQIGRSDDIYAHPQTEFVATFIGETNLLDAELVATAGRHWVFQAGPMRFRVPAEGSAPRQLTLSVRPERIRVGDRVEGCDDVAPGRVRDVVHGGSVIRYQIAVGDHVLSAQVPNDSDRTYAPGDQIEVGWRLGDAVPMLRSPGSARDEGASAPEAA